MLKNKYITSGRIFYAHVNPELKQEYSDLVDEYNWRNTAVIKYKDLETEYNNLKNKHDEISQQNILLINQNSDKDKYINQIKSEMNILEQQIIQKGNELNEYKLK